jgi:hypothetical protein
MGGFDRLIRMFGGGPEVEYQSIGISRLKKLLQHTFPKELIPSNRTGSFLGSIFVVVIVASLFRFPLNEFLSGNLEVQVGVGYPWSFLVFDLLNPMKSPLMIKEFIWSLLLYLFLAYLIEVFINYTLRLEIFKSKKEKNEKPKFFKDVKETAAGRLTKKIFGGPKSSTKKNVAEKDGKFSGGKREDEFLKKPVVAQVNSVPMKKPVVASPVLRPRVVAPKPRVAPRVKPVPVVVQPRVPIDQAAQAAKLKAQAENAKKRKRVSYEN